jgi:hypothetical protein
VDRVLKVLFGLYGVYKLKVQNPTQNPAKLQDEWINCKSNVNYSQRVEKYPCVFKNSCHKIKNTK